MEIYLVRHTSVNAEDKKRCYGFSDVSLAPTFQEEIANTIGKLSIEIQQDTLLFSSPLSRCMTLAQGIQQAFSIEKITEDERLKEMNFGDWEGLFWSDIPEEVTMPWMQDFVNVPTPNGENFVALATRANAFWQEITARYSAKQQIVVTTHGGVIRSMISSLFEMELKNAFRFEISYGSITKISIRHGIPKVEYLNK